MMENKHILVVGATSGIGFSVVDTLLNQGAKLSVTTRDLSKIPDEWKRAAVSMFSLDVTSQDQLVEFVQEIEDLDGLVYAPGVVKLFPAAFLNTKQIDVVRKPVFDGAALLISLMLRGKKINRNASLVFVSSISSSAPYKGGAVYASSKAALETYSKVLALELADKGIRSNCVKAGLVQTKMLEETKKNTPEEIYNLHTEKYPLGIGMPEDVANAIVFFLSEKSKWITGTELVLDGGLTAGL